MPRLDEIDRAIVTRLQQNARISNKELAAAVGVAPSTALARTRRLEETGVLVGYHAEVSAEAVGAGLQAMIGIALRRHQRALVEAFEAHVLGLPEVVQLFHTTGASDYLVHVAVRDTAHLRALALEAFTERPEVARIETALLFAHRRTAGVAIPARG
ncbi:Lrp/AsnC family transcriptional regulator [Rubrivirga sp. IMCC43871]|uniref:Lrp/AsnC family transcriptional regulator n=1 Tax=Rubrivirga sp. IMCC43871 TaxID=3391575 RepID=UPI0039901673